MKTKKFNYGPRKVCRTLKRMREAGWIAFLDKKNRLRLSSPEGRHCCPETALFLFSGNPQHTPEITGNFREIELVVAPALNQNPQTALLIAVSSDSGDETETLTYQYTTCEEVYPSRAIRRALFRACGISIKHI